MLMPSAVVDYRKRGRSFYVLLDVTNTCNLRCEMCNSIRVLMKPGEKVYHTPLPLFRRIAEMVFPYTKKLQLSCAFEALVHPDINEIIDIVGTCGIPGTGLVTNGMLLTSEIAERIINARITDVAVSIDSPDKEIFESIRRGAKFERVIENVKGLVRLRDSLDKTLPNLRINHVLMTSTIERIEAFCELCIDLGAVCVVFVHMYPYSEANPEYLGVKPELFANYREKAIAMLEKAGIEYSMPPPFDTTEGSFLTIDPEETRKMAANCRSPWHLLQINSRGDVFPCASRLLNPPYGNLQRQTLSEVWNNLKYLKLRNDLLKKRPHNTCETCQSFSAPSFEDTYV